MKDIETGVDKLVELISQEKKISVEDAARKLGISKVVIQEWAAFLEEEKIISIEYKFSKTFLLERKLTEKEVKVKEKEYSSEKDAFVRKIESSLKNLEKESAGLEKIKEEFGKLKKDIGGEIEKVEKEVKELEKYEYLKDNLDSDIKKQMDEFHELIENSHKELDFEQKKHQEILSNLEIEKREVAVKEHRLRSLEEKEEELMNRIQEILNVSKQLHKKVSQEKTGLGDSKKRIIHLENAVKDIESDILKKRKTVQPLIDKAKKHEEDIINLQQKILEKAKEKTDAIKSKVEQSVKASDNFKKFFDKKNEVGTLIEKIDFEKKELRNAFLMLKKKAIAFDLSAKKTNIKTHMKEMESELGKINDKKENLKQDLEKLIKLVED